MNFKGAAKKLDDIDLPTLGKKLSVGEDELHAFIDVETRGSGFDDKGRPRILFERHKFWKYCTPAQRQKAPDDICNKVPGGYGKASEQYDRLARAMKINAKGSATVGFIPAGFSMKADATYQGDCSVAEAAKAKERYLRENPGAAAPQ